MSENNVIQSDNAEQLRRGTSYVCRCVRSRKWDLMASCSAITATGKTPDDDIMMNEYMDIDNDDDIDDEI